MNHVWHPWEQLGNNWNDLTRESLLSEQLPLVPVEQLVVYDEVMQTEAFYILHYNLVRQLYVAIPTATALATWLYSHSDIDSYYNELQLTQLAGYSYKDIKKDVM